MSKLPKYVKLGHSALRLLSDEVYGSHYYRDAGMWHIGFVVKDNKLFAKSLYSEMNHAEGLELVPISKKEWKEDNLGYV